MGGRVGKTRSKTKYHAKIREARQQIPKYKKLHLW